MTRLSTTLSIFILLLSFSSLSQEDSKNAFTLPEIIRPSPTVSQLMKFEEVDLNHYTGQPNISVPLFSKRIHGLDYNLALHYNVSGIRVNEQSGWVGKGWALETGGVISRSVVGLPDNLNIESVGYRGVNHNQFYDHWDWILDNNFYPDGPVFPNSDAYKIREFYYNSQHANRVKEDYQRDIYQFNFFGHTGRFLFVKENGILIPKIIGNDSKLKIEATYETNELSLYPKQIDYFTVTDNNGLIYTFDQYEETLKKDVTLINPRGNSASAPSTPEIQVPKFRSAWKLSDVSTNNGENILNIQYTEVLEKPLYDFSNYITYGIKPHDAIIPTSNEQCKKDAIQAALQPHRITNTQLIEIESKKAMQISFSDGTVLNFNHSLVPHPEYREDTGVKLTNIEIRNNSIINKSFDFEYINKPKLLFLDKITENNELEFDFEYFELGLLNDFEDTKDVFGYYKSDFVEDYKTEVKAGSLVSITYPTGGKKKFNWESNTYSYKGDKLLSFDEIFQNPDNYELDVFHLTYDSTDYNSNNTLEANPIIFHIDIDQSISVTHSINTPEGVQTPNGYAYSVDFIPITCQNNTSIDPNRETQSVGNIGGLAYGESSVYLKNGWYKILPFNQNYAHPGYTISLSFHHKELKTGSLNWWVYGGGLRINSIEDVDYNNQLKKVSYNYSLEPGQYEAPQGMLNPPSFFFPMPDDYPTIIKSRDCETYEHNHLIHNFSSGSFDGIESLTREYITFIKPMYNVPGLVNNPVKYYVTEGTSNLTAQFTQGSLIGYKNIAQYNSTSSIEFGQKDIVKDHSVTKYLFDSPIDYPTFPDSYIYPFEPLEIYKKDYLRGNLRELRLFNNQNQLIKKIKNSYNFDNNYDIRDFVCWNLYFAENETTLSGTGEAWFLRKIYNSFEHLVQNEPYSLQYQNSNCSEGPGALASVILFSNTLSSVDALTIGPSRKYAEYSYKVLKTGSITKDYFYNDTEQPEANGYIISDKILETRQEFEYYPENYQLKEQNTYMSENGIEQHLQTKYHYSGAGSLGNSSNLVSQNRINEITAIEQFKNGEHLNTIINNYHSFQSGITELSEVKSKKDEDIVNPELRIEYHKYDAYGNPLEISKPGGAHIVYIWGYNHTLPVAKIEGASYSSIETLSEFGENFYLQNGLSNDQEVQLRESFTNAIVTTYTYDIIKGITSVTDPRGNKTTYEYDDFNRLKYVKDQDNNILSENKYNYRTTQN